MRAAVYGGAGGVEVIAVRDDVPEPEVGSEDAVVEVAYAGLNRADVLERQGRYPVAPAAIAIPGIEYSGTVRALGAQVTSLHLGDRVCGLVQRGAHAERLSAHALTISKVPDGLDLATAAAIPEAFITAHDALFARARFALGQTALIHAVGSSVGLAAVELVRRAGGVALGTSRTPEKLVRARAHGLDQGYEFVEGWVEHVLDATGGRGADVILDFAGAETLDDNLKALAPRGRIVSIGTLGGTRASFNLGAMMGKRAEVHGTVLRTRPLDERIGLAKHFALEQLPLFARGELRTEIDRTFPLAELAAAHEWMEGNRNFGKILIEIGGESRP
jgi:NADPH:quinone reductase-like Zn-dependent oxidoreductase